MAMEGKSQSALSERQFFDNGLKRYCTEGDLRGIKAASAIAQRWSSTGAFIGLVTGCIVGFPYPRQFSRTFLSTLRQIRSQQLAVPTGTSPFYYAIARAHREGAEVAGAKGLRDGSLSARGFMGFSLKNSIVGAAWALFFSFAGRTGGALASTYPAEQAIKEQGGDVERIKQAANQVVLELTEAKLRANERGGRLEPPPRNESFPTFDSDVERSSEQAAGDLSSRADQDAFMKQDGPRPTPRANFSAAGSRLNQAITYMATAEDDSSSPPVSPAQSATDAPASKSRWDELRGNRQQEPSTWERIRQEQSKPTTAAPVDKSSPIERPAEVQSADERDRRQRDFQALLDKESQGGDDASAERSRRRI